MNKAELSRRLTALECAINTDSVIAVMKDGNTKRIDLMKEDILQLINDLDIIKFEKGPGKISELLNGMKEGEEN